MSEHTGGAGGFVGSLALGGACGWWMGLVPHTDSFWGCRAGLGHPVILSMLLDT